MLESASLAGWSRGAGDCAQTTAWPSGIDVELHSSWSSGSACDSW